MKPDFKTEFLNKVSKIGKQWGLGASAGRVWGVLLFNSNPLTQKEIAKQSSYSPGLVSQSLKVLEQMSMLSVVGNKGKERLYGAAVSFIDSFDKVLRNFVEQDVAPIIQVLESNLDQVNDPEVKNSLKLLITDQKKINILLDFFSKVLVANKSLEILEIKKTTKRLAQGLGDASGCKMQNM